jgi:hypothetical protein
VDIIHIHFRKEKIFRLEFENKQLKASGGAEKVMELESKLDDANRLNAKYVQVNNIIIDLINN